MGSVYFDFNFGNWPSILISLVPALLNIGVVFYIIAAMPKKSISRAFWLFTLSLVFWQLGDTSARISNTGATAAFWDSVFCVGWMFLAPLGLYFVLLYTGRKELARTNLMISALFLPALAFEVAFKTNLFPHVYQYDSFWGWVDNHNSSVIDEVMVIWITAQVFIMLGLLWAFALKSKNVPLLKEQSLIIAIGLSIPAVQGIITQAILPIFFKTKAIPVTSTFLSFFSIATVVALSRYRLFSLASSIKAEVLLENMTDIVITLSPEKTIAYINPYGEELLGLKTKDQNIEKIFSGSDGQFGIFSQKVLQPVLEGRFIDNFETVLNTANGEEIYISLSADPIIEEQQIMGILLVARNISDLKKAEANLLEKNTELERSNAELETFAFVASHDLKEPIRMVSNYTQLLEKRYAERLDEDGKEFIKYAVEGVHRMQALINDLLNYSRIGKSVLRFGVVDCNVVVKDALSRLDNKIKEEHATVTVANLPSVWMVSELVGQVFQNLIENGIKYHSDAAPMVEIKAERGQDEWLFSVKDNGIGIDKRYHDKVFVIFQRLHDRSHYTGTGIGLSVCKKIVELHGGKIWFESELRQGTAFYFTIPDKE